MDPRADARGHGRWEREKVVRDLSDTAVRDHVGTDQIAYYRARAPWYDDVYTCAGDYDGGPERNRQWLEELAAIEAALSKAPLHGDCVELGAGTGYWTERVVDRVDRLWALDAVPEVLETARARLGARAAKIEFDVVDLWRWQPDRVWDCALACFFVEHVPDEALPALLRVLHDALRPGGTVFVAEAGAVDSRAEPQVETRAIGAREYEVVERPRTPAEFGDVFGAAGFSVQTVAAGRCVCLTATRD